MNSAQAAQNWVEAWSSGWANHDPDLIAGRYAPDGRFRSHPFRATTSGSAGAADYARQAFEEEAASSFVFGDPIVGQDGRAAVEYRAVITNSDGSKSTLAGVTVLRFDEGGRVTEHRDYWAMAEGDLGLSIEED